MSRRQPRWAVSNLNNQTIMKSFITLMTAVLTTAAAAADAAKPIATPVVKPNEMMLKVGGIVCQFCAFGVAKNLAGLEFMDRTKLKNGVFVDIEKQHVAVALTAGKAPDFAGINKSIKRGGYDLISAHLLIQGKLEQPEGRWLLRDEIHGAQYVLEGKPGAAWSIGNRVSIQGEVSGKAIAAMKPGQPLVVTVNQLEVLK